MRNDIPCRLWHVTSIEFADILQHHVYSNNTQWKEIVYQFVESIVYSVQLYSLHTTQHTIFFSFAPFFLLIFLFLSINASTRRISNWRTCKIARILHCWSMADERVFSQNRVDCNNLPNCFLQKVISQLSTAEDIEFILWWTENQIVI